MLLRSVRILVFFGQNLVTTEHCWKTLLWDGNPTNLLSISYTDYHDIKTVYKS